MRLLLRQVRVCHPASPHHGETLDLLLEAGRVVRLGQSLELPEEAHLVEEEGLVLVPGLVDVGVQVGDPGYEHREDLRSATRAALFGGFTDLVCQPNTLPPMDSKAEVAYLKNQSAALPVDFWPLGAVSVECRGQDITEMLDMHHAGALGFTDGEHPVQDNGLMLRALLYVKAFDGVVLNHPHDARIALDGQMHEGPLSTSLGLKGIPPLAEELMVQRDLFLAEYTGSRLHLSCLSTAASVELVRKAKERGLPVTASVAALNLAFDDSALRHFDTLFKVLPPLRSPEDRQALIQGLKDGTLDFIVSNHVPLEEELKNVEFPFAAFGATTLEGAFALSRFHLREHLSLEDLVEKWALAPRRLLGLPIPEILPGAEARFTLLQPNETWTFTPEHIRSRSRNSPLPGQTLLGRVRGVIAGGEFMENL